MIANLHFVKELGLKSKSLLESGKTTKFGRVDGMSIGSTRSAGPAASAMPISISGITSA